MVVKTPRSALIVKLGQIGDVIMAVPAARALYEKGFSIDWVCGNAARPILECYSWIRVVPVDDAAILRGGLLKRIRHIAGFWSRVFVSHYDLCALLYYDRRYRVLVWPVRAKRTISLARGSRAKELLPGRHHTDEFVRILLSRDDGCQEQSTAAVRPDRLPACPLPAKTAKCRIAIVPGGTSNLLRQQTLRRWPIDGYVALATHLLSRGWETVLLGGSEDAWVRPHFEHLPVTNCIGTLSLGEVVACCDACDGIVSHDTGPLHLAGLSNTCVVGLFGPTPPATFLPRRNFSVGLWGGEGFACRPCFDGVDFAPCQFNGCMHQITPERVLRELDRLLDERSRGVPSAWRIAFPSDAAGVGLG